MKKIKTQLGKQVARMLDQDGSEYTLLASKYMYDTFQIEIDDHRVMNFVCHEYPGLSNGVMIHSKFLYELAGVSKIDELINSANEANLRATSVTTAIELHKDKKDFLAHFKSFVHLDPKTENTNLIDQAMHLHTVEIEEVVLPIFDKNYTESE